MPSFVLFFHAFLLSAQGWSSFLAGWVTLVTPYTFPIIRCINEKLLFSPF